ncbi:CCA-adding enzyme [Methanosalsum zhilinae DSM 4017]|uniref:CCA-adding enzyme n=1 Tax=Methanosalsum zhilinae (strain DSM 4017 / NBRC 107636 / OCM 62 / WeN5) TaxID=679901 RepID=F7XKY1_METZD|nr:CCA tRNA nucleotidyltransferase [Methanosalsum zhilinae]AEH60679.1 CCA-adding enzyme [Methanosalsum zhilinae DSM 4017]
MQKSSLERLQDIKEEVLSKIKPTGSEKAKLKKITDHLISKVNKAIEKQGISGLSVQLVGSASRNTWISGTHDLDIFIIFPEETERIELERAGLSIAREVAKEAERFEERYAEHPYINMNIEEFDVDLVPCFGVTDASCIKSSVDRTPFHNEFVKKHINGLADEVRLLKQFMRGTGVYGSELKTQGFSGYLTELLIIHFGSFENVIFSAVDWKPGLKIKFDSDPLSDSFKGRKDPLIVIDPTDPDRNVAAAVSINKFCEFVDAAREFLTDPSERYFFPEDIVTLTDKDLKDRMRSRGTDLIVICFKKPDEVEDVIYPQLYKMEKSVSDLLEQYQFRVMRSFSWAGENEKEAKAIVYFELISSRLPQIKKHIGPPVWLRDHAEKFKLKYKHMDDVFSFYIEDGKYVCDIPRKYTSATSLLKSRLNTCSLGKHISASVNEGFQILENKEICAIKYCDFRKLFNRYI